MRRVVVTGLGIVSCIGNDLDVVADALPTVALRHSACRV